MKNFLGGLRKMLIFFANSDRKIFLIETHHLSPISFSISFIWVPCSEAEIQHTEKSWVRPCSKIDVPQQRSRSRKMIPFLFSTYHFQYFRFNWRLIKAFSRKIVEISWIHPTTFKEFWSKIPKKTIFLSKRIETWLSFLQNETFCSVGQTQDSILADKHPYISFKKM